MSNSETLSALSHYQYQYRQNISRLGLHSTSNQNVSLISKLRQTDFDFLKDCLHNGKNILLSHASPLGQNEEELKASLEGITVLKGDKLIAYCINVDENKEQTVFVDLFNIQELIYKPFLIKILDIVSKSKQKNVSKQYILYHHTSQQRNIKGLIHDFACQADSLSQIQSCFIEVELSVPTPFQYIVAENLLEILEKFLGDQAKQTQKRDVLIFKSLNEQFKKKMFYLTKTRGFHISTTLLYEDSQNFVMNPATTNIVVVSNTSALRALSNVIDFSRFYLILDFEEDVYKYFDYQRCCYVQVRDKMSYSQKCNRACFGLGNLGEYVCQGQTQGKIEIVDQKEQGTYKDYGTYCLRMIQLGLGWWLDKQQKLNDQIRFCNETLKNLQMIKQNKLNITDNIVDLCAEGINPIICNSVLAKQKQQNLKLQHLLVLTEAILCCPDIRTQFNSQANVMPSSIWHKNGYLQSCLDIIIKCIFLEKNSQNALITIEDILSDFQVSQDKFSTVLRHYQKLCKLLHIQPVQLGSGLQQDDYVSLIEELITILKPAVGTFSGSRRLGYLFKGFHTGFLAHKKSLMSFYNQKPNFILVTKLLIDRESQKPFILTCNYVRDDILITTYGCLPTLSKQSFGQCEVQFHKISSAVFAHLSKYDGLQMTIFENENQCSVEANSQLNAITIQCSKERQKQISEKFTKVLADIQDMFKKETKSFMQTTILKVVLGNGAEIVDLTMIEKDKKNQILEMAVLKNLAPEIGIEELKQLFDEFIQLRDIKMTPKQTGNQALISFYSVQDYKRFYQIFSGCVYYDHSMIIQPYVDETRTINEEECLLFQWNVWKSTGEALIEFETPEAAKSALTNFKSLAGTKVTVEVKANMIFAERLDQNVDQKDIAAWVSGHGKVNNIQIRRYHAHKEANEQVSIRNIVRRAFPKQQVICHPDKIVKGKNGHRSCKVAVPNKQTMNQIFFILNEVRGVLGNGKLYVSPLFSWPLKLPEPDQIYANVYLDIIEDLSKEMNRVEPLRTELCKQPMAWTLVIQSNSEQQMQIIKSFLPERIKGTVLNVKQSELLFTEIAQKNFQKLQKKLPIKIVPEIISKKIKVLCRPSLHQIIEKQINTQIEESFSYKLPLYQKAFAYLQLNIAEILTEQAKCGLKYFFEPINKSLNLEGNLMILERARQKINKSLAVLKSKAQEDNLGNEEICGLCCQQFKHSFKLQGCGHAFCFDCLQSSVKYSLQDINLYPLKCPQCAQKIWISDLSCLLPQKQWNNILKNSVNHFVYRHPGQFMFCLTVGCSFICDVKFKSSYNCPECKKGYCLQCNNQNHPGMTCHEARYGSDRLFNQYMSNIGGRVCANKACKAPIERISGCFKVQCLRCKKCMCFKCPANSMVAYDTPEQTYNHLNKIHGGCF